MPRDEREINRSPPRLFDMLRAQDEIETRGKRNEMIVAETGENERGGSLLKLADGRDIRSLNKRAVSGIAGQLGVRAIVVVRADWGLMLARPEVGSMVQYVEVTSRRRQRIAPSAEKCQKAPERCLFRRAIRQCYCSKCKAFLLSRGESQRNIPLRSILDCSARAGAAFARDAAQRPAAARRVKKDNILSRKWESPEAHG